MVHDAQPGKPTCSKCGSGDVDEDEFGISCLDCGFTKETAKKISTTTCPKCNSQASVFLHRGVHTVVCAHCRFDERIELDSTSGTKSGTKSREPYKTGGSRRSQ